MDPTTDAQDSIDVPNPIDVPNTTDVPNTIDKPSTTDVPNPIDIPNTTDVPSNTDVPKTADALNTIDVPNTTDALNTNPSEPEDSIPFLGGEGEGTTIIRKFIPLDEIVRTSKPGPNEPEIDREVLTARLQKALEETFGVLNNAPPKQNNSSSSSSAPAPKDGETWSTPENGKYYYLKNVGNSNAKWLEVVDGKIGNGAQVVAWERNSPVAANQVWKVVKKKGDDAYLIQNVCTLLKDGKIRTDNIENSYLRVADIDDDQKVYHGSKAFKWKFEQVGKAHPTFKIRPVDDKFAALFALRTVNDQLRNVDAASPRLRFEIEDEPGTKQKLSERQLWAFIEVPSFVLKDNKWL